MTTKITITTGHPITWEQWVQAVEQLEARAVLAETCGLKRTARCWREMIEVLGRSIVIDHAATSDYIAKNERKSEHQGGAQQQAPPKG